MLAPQATVKEVSMNSPIGNAMRRRACVAIAMLLAAAPVFAQSARIVSQGAAYAYAEERAATRRTIDRALGLPGQGEAQVVFFRPAMRAGGHAVVAEGGRPVASVGGDSYVTIAIPPGAHAFTVGGTPLRLQLGAGERRYVRITDGRGGPQLQASQAPRFLRDSLAKR
jgi:hypothetical protein